MGNKIHDHTFLTRRGSEHPHNTMVTILLHNLDNVQPTQTARNDNVQHGHIIIGRRRNGVGTTTTSLDVRILTPTRADH
jgi:hypothetical protein